MNKNELKVTWKNITCPHCSEKIIFEKSESGKWTGRIVGGTVGYWLASGLGIAGGILGFPIAMAAGIVGLSVGAITGNSIGEKIDNSNTTCPKCKKGLIL